MSAERSGEYVLLKDDPRMGLSAGDVLACIPYWLDLQAKLTVERRISDGFDPGCNVYRCQVARRMADGELQLLRCDCGCAPRGVRQAALTARTEDSDG